MHLRRFGRLGRRGWRCRIGRFLSLGRISGALLGFWLNGRVTFARDGAARLGWWRFAKFLLVWVPLTVVSTLAVTWVATSLGLAHAWLAKPLVEGVLAVVAFFLWRHVVYR